MRNLKTITLGLLIAVTTLTSCKKEELIVDDYHCHKETVEVVDTTYQEDDIIYTLVMDDDYDYEIDIISDEGGSEPVLLSKEYVDGKYYHRYLCRFNERYTTKFSYDTYGKVVGRISSRKVYISASSGKYVCKTDYLQVIDNTIADYAIDYWYLAHDRLDNYALIVDPEYTFFELIPHDDNIVKGHTVKTPITEMVE